jgi:hypothetical protein
MTHNDDLPQIVEGIRQFSLSLSKSVVPFRWVGYGMLVLAVLSWVVLLTPVQLLNPTWEFQTMGALVERMPVLLLALLLIFFGEMSLRKPWERWVVGSLSWMCLVLGILFFCLVPLGILNPIRINQQNAIAATAEYDRQLSEATQLEAQLDQATPEDILAFLERQGMQVNIEDPQQIKAVLQQEIENQRDQLTADYNALRHRQRLALIKNAVHWNVGAIIVGVLLIYLWRSSRWARQGKASQAQ